MLQDFIYVGDFLYVLLKSSLDHMQVEKIQLQFVWDPS